MRNYRGIFYVLGILVILSMAVSMLSPNTLHKGIAALKSRIVDQRFSVADRLAQFGSAARQRLEPYFKQAQLAYPPTAVRLLAFKDTKQLELYALNPQGKWLKVKDYPIQAASGVLGPKLKEGDRQVPEGIYQIESLNPNSLFHVALRLSYPNIFDQQMGAIDGRSSLGSDIMLHGKAVSIGCLAMGDEAAEELFTLAALVGKENMQVIIAPTDFRKLEQRPLLSNPPVWIETLYQSIRSELSNYPI